MKQFRFYRQWLSYPLFKRLQRNAKPMSATEKIALNAGDPWWEAEFFTGKPDWDTFEKLQLSQLNAAEQQFLDNETQALCELLDNWQISQRNDLPPKVWQFIQNKGFWGLVIDQKYGGKGFSAALHSAVVMKVASRSLTAAVTVMVPNSLGPGELIQAYGTTQQKKYYLPRLAKGLEIPCFALTGPNAGSDAASMTDTGVVYEQTIDGKKTLGIKLNFSKRYITLAPVATLIGLAFKLSDPQHLLGDPHKTDYGITVCLLPRKTPGITIGQRHNPLNQNFMNGPIQGQDIFVPLDAIIGGQAKIGHGWQMLMECLAVGRAISLPAVSCGYCAFAALTTGAYAALREQFSLPIARFEGIQEKLAPITGFAYILNATRLLTLSAADQGKRPAVASAIAKYHATELSREALNHAMDIHGGKGIILGPHNYLGTAYQGMPICITVEGANILTRNLIIFGQGAVQSHPYLQTILNSLQSQDKSAYQQFDGALFGLFRQIIRNAYFAKWWRITGARFSKTPSSSMQVYYQQINRLSAGFALVTDIALIKLGETLKRKERLSARLGDVMSYLYMASAVLKYFASTGEPISERMVAEWAVQHCLHKAASALDQLLRHFPGTLTRLFLRGLIMPFGMPYQAPNDVEDAEIADLMTHPSDIRKCFAQLCFIPTHPKEHIAIIETAFQLEYQLTLVTQRLKRSLKDLSLPDGSTMAAKIKAAEQANIITHAEAKQLLTLEKLRAQIIAVDAF